MRTALIISPGGCQMESQEIRISENVDILYSGTHLYVKVTDSKGCSQYPALYQDGSIGYVNEELLTIGQIEQVRKAYDLLGRQFRRALVKK